MSTLHRTLIEFTWDATRGITDYERADWSIVIRGHGETDGWPWSRDLPTMHLRDSAPVEVEALVRALHAQGLFGDADTVDAHCVRMDAASFMPTVKG